MEERCVISVSDLQPRYFRLGICAAAGRSRIRWSRPTRTSRFSSSRLAIIGSFDSGRVDLSGSPASSSCATASILAQPAHAHRGDAAPARLDHTHTPRSSSPTSSSSTRSAGPARRGPGHAGAAAQPRRPLVLAARRHGRAGAAGAEWTRKNVVPACSATTTRSGLRAAADLRPLPASPCRRVRKMMRYTGYLRRSVPGTSR